MHQQPETPLAVFRVNCSKLFLWGATYAMAIISWMHQVKWPAELLETQQDPGITWIELFTSFVFHTGLVAPLRRQADSHEVLIFFETWQDIDFYGARVSDMVAAFSNMIAQLRGLTNPWIWPAVPKGFAKSTRRFWVGWVQARPSIFPNLLVASTQYRHVYICTPPEL